MKFHTYIIMYIVIGGTCSTGPVRWQQSLALVTDQHRACNCCTLEIGYNDLAYNDLAYNDLAYNDLAYNDLAYNDLAYNDRLSLATQFCCPSRLVSPL